MIQKFWGTFPRSPYSRLLLGFLLLETLTAFSPTSVIAADHTVSNGLIADQSAVESFVDQYCMDCHNQADAIADFDVESVPLSQVDWSPQRTATVASDPLADWETAFKRIASRQMPPADADRPTDDEYHAAIESLGRVLDSVAADTPRIPNVDSLRRLTRTEYQNSVRDLLGIEVDITAWLPKDESSGGFDNITVGDLSPSLMSRYLTAAEQISRIAIGRQVGTPMGINVRLPADLTQEQHIAGLPLGTRGGTNIRHTFAESGVYEIAVRLTRDRDEMIEGLFRPHDLDVLIDRKPTHRWTLEPPKGNRDDTLIDANLNVRVPITAGPHDIAVTFVSQGDSLLEIKRQPFDSAYNRHRHPRQQPALFEVAIVGPLSLPENDTELPAGAADTPSRRIIFAERPQSSDIESQLAAADSIFRRLSRIAFRRDVTDADIATAMNFFEEAIREDNDLDPNDRFELGIERGVASILVNPNFLFHVERPVDPGSSEPIVRISEFELASRMAAFLWSSLPDEDLLDLAASGSLSDPAVIHDQVARMLADQRSQSLVDHFAAQWLYLRNLDAITPDLRLFPDFDENLRRAFRGETASVFAHVLQTDASILAMIDSDFTFLNERLARHYDIPGVLGDEFRQVALPADSHRGGILRHGSILSVTSYATRTSPTIRGNWILENIVGTPPPPPPPDVPTLKEKSALTPTTFRERLALHRQNDACASCHALIDPVGFSLDHYDAVGRWRTYDGEYPIDASGTLPDGTEVDGVEDLEASLLEHPEMFVSCFAEKLMTFALGRVVTHHDAAAIRGIVRQAAEDDYRVSNIIQGIVASPQFQNRSRL
ncbi:DUF1592 domain-containing protein [Aporhodopirellula aestuarii]|uniref:DUF1592 domain-containing protein n=1 Tax=Aporhodopirellula aestuarii TaxID=2950107 RepID=A0ABT0UCV6_9BACT|nr:DUF1592 domain-containing protein [Aporhodopirellula aestuarii]MCM2374733.1 DUF1592 domain-containing protein [Aporhodopirellula aestuarii]